MVKKFIKNTTWVLVSNILSKILNFLTLGILARALNPESLGYYNAVQNSGNYINMMSSLGTMIVLQRTGARIHELGSQIVGEIFSNIFTLYLMINLLGGIIITLFPNYFFSLLLDSQGEVNFMFVISIIVFLNALGQIPLYLIQGLEEFKVFSIRNVFSALSVLFITALFVFFIEDNLKAAFIGLGISYLVNAILTGLALIRTKRKFQLQIRFSLRYSVLSQIIHDGFLYYVGNTFFGAIIGLVVISLFFNHLSSFEYGFTRIGNAFAVLLSLIPAAIQPVTISMLSIKNERSQYLKSLQIRLIPFFSTLMLVIVAFNMELLLSLMFGPQYKEARDIVFGMILVQIPYIYLGLINNYQVGAGHLNFIGWVAVLGSTSMIVFSFLLMPVYGVRGYFAAMYISTFLALAIVSFKEYYKTEQWQQKEWNSLWLIVMLVGLSYVMMYITPDMFRIPLTIFSLLAACLLFWLFCMQPDERRFLMHETQKRGLGFSLKSNNR